MSALSPPSRGQTRHERSDGAKDGAGVQKEGRGCPRWPRSPAGWGPTPPPWLSSRGDSGGTHGEGTRQPKQ